MWSILYNHIVKYTKTTTITIAAYILYIEYMCLPPVSIPKKNIISIR